MSPQTPVTEHVACHSFNPTGTHPRTGSRPTCHKDDTTEFQSLAHKLKEKVRLAQLPTWHQRNTPLTQQDSWHLLDAWVVFFRCKKPTMLELLELLELLESETHKDHWGEKWETNRNDQQNTTKHNKTQNTAETWRTAMGWEDMALEARPFYAARGMSNYFFSETLTNDDKW